MKMENPNQGFDSTLRGHLAAKGIELTVVPDDTPGAQTQGVSPVAIDTDDQIRALMTKGKEGWKEVDYKLESAVNELRTLERSKGDKDDSRIKELRKEIDNLKDEKIPTPTNGKTIPQETLEAARDRRRQLNAFKLDSAKNGLNQLKGKGVGDNDPRVKGLLAEIATLENKPIRGGKKGKADSAILGPALKQVIADKESAEGGDNNEELLKGKKELLLNLGEALALEREENVPEERKKLIQENIRDARKKLIEFGQEHPELVDPLEDNTTLQKIISEQAEGRATAKNTGDALQESLQNGDTEFVADKDALGKIAEFEKQNEINEAAVPLEQTVAPIPDEQAIEAAKEVFHTETGVTATEAASTQSLYAKAMDDRWAEIETTMKAAGQSTGEDLTLEPLTPKPTQLENIPVPVGKEGPHLLTHEEISGPFSVIEGEFTRVLGEKTAEQMKQEKLLAKTLVMTGITKVIEERAEKINALDNVRNAGTLWNKVPKRYKYMFTAGAILSGVGAVAAGSAVGIGAALTLSTTLRGLGGAGLFVTFENMLKIEHEKKTGGERSKETEARHAIFAGIGAVVIAGLMGKAAGNIIDLFSTEAVTATTPHATPATPKIEYTVEKGGTLWGGIEHSLDAKGMFAGMHEGQKTYIIDALKDKFATMSPDELRAIGITSGNINMINPGDHIDLTKVLGDTQTIPDIIHHAEMLTSEQIASIEHPVVAHPTPEVAPTAPTPEGAATMPQEIAPTSPEIIAAANSTTTDFYNQVLGTKGLWGIGAQDGTKMLDWTDPVDGFAHKTITEIRAAHPSAFPNPENGGTPTGIKNFTAHEKMLRAFKEIFEKTGVSELPGETPIDYSNRAAVTALTRGTFEGKN